MPTPRAPPERVADVGSGDKCVWNVITAEKYSFFFFGGGGGGGGGAFYFHFFLWPAQATVQ